MPRSLWRGSLSFGLVNVPVAMFSAVRDIDVHFNQIDAESGARLRVIRVCDGLLQLNTMVFHAEIRPTDELPIPGGRKDAPSKDEVKQAVALVEELSTDWKPSKYKDRHTRRLKDIVRKKEKGQTIKAP